MTDADVSGLGLGGQVLAIFGPTASGKSAVAEALSERIPAEIVSADAMQAYRGLPILTNQPGRPTRLVGIWPLDHEGSVGEYQRLAHAGIDEVLAVGRTPVVAGGTGLYLRAALAELELPPPPPAAARERWELLYDEGGAEAAHAKHGDGGPLPLEARERIAALSGEKVEKVAETSGSRARPSDCRRFLPSAGVTVVVDCPK